MSTTRSGTSVGRRVTLFAVPLAATVLVSACSGGSNVATSPVAATQSGAAQANNGQGGNASGGFSGRGRPGVSGLIAEVSGTTMQVQDGTSQTAVSWTSSTAIAKQVKATAADVRVGLCVVARPAQATTTQNSASPNPTAGSGAAANGSAANAASSTTVQAATVSLSEPTGGQCTASFGGGRGPDDGFRGGPPSGQAVAPSAGASQGGSAQGGSAQGGNARGRFGDGAALFGAIGKVTAVSANGFTVESTVRLPNGTGPTPSATASSSSSMQTTRTVTVVTNSTTTYTRQATGTAADIVTGQCASAVGQADSTGAVTATRIVVSAPIDGSCLQGGRFGGTNRTANG